MNLPAEVFEDFLAEAIAIAGAAARVVARAVTFDAQQERTDLSGMLHSKIDEKASDTNLGHAIVAILPEDGSHGALEVIRGLIQSIICLLQDAGTGKNQILLQGPHAPWAIGGRLDPFGIERTEHDGALFGAGEKYV